MKLPFTPAQENGRTFTTAGQLWLFDADQQAHLLTVLGAAGTATSSAPPRHLSRALRWPNDTLTLPEPPVATLKLGKPRWRRRPASAVGSASSRSRWVICKPRRRWLGRPTELPRSF